MDVKADLSGPPSEAYLAAPNVRATHRTLDGRSHTVTYDDARRVVLAFIDSLVLDRRPPGDHVPPDQPLPVGPNAGDITAVASRDEGWEVVANGWTFDVERQADRLVVTASSFPIP